MFVAGGPHAAQAVRHQHPLTSEQHNDRCFTLLRRCILDECSLPSRHSAHLTILFSTTGVIKGIKTSCAMGSKNGTVDKNFENFFAAVAAVVVPLQLDEFRVDEV
jgi:hypothetical protein